VRRDADYTEYVSARRARLVRSAVLFGCAPSEAEDVVQTALIRCYRHWEKVAAARDADAYVYRVLLNFADLSERQIAEATSVPVGTVKSRLSRGLAQLSADPQIAGLNRKGVDDAHRR
jgi:DNA-directed RNA polymerase specialized sigma24 family protein